MKIFKKHFSFSKILVFLLVVSFFAILLFDGYIIIKLINLIQNGFDLTYATVIGTIVSTMSGFADAVILFAIKGYLTQATKDHEVGYDAKTNTTADERLKALMKENMSDPETEGA